MSNWQVGFYLFLYCLFSSLVPRRVHPFFTALGNHLLFPLMWKTRQVVEKNLRVIGRGEYSQEEIRTLAKRCFQNYSHKLLDYMSMHRLDLSNRWKLVEREVGEEHLVRALERGKGVICITPHLGNWELGGYVLASKGYPVNILTLREGSAPQSQDDGGAGIPFIHDSPMKVHLIAPGWSPHNIWGQIKFKFPPLSLTTPASFTPEDVEVAITDEGLDEINFEDGADLVGITAMTPQANRAYQIADEFRRRGAKVILGGFHPSTMPDEALSHADAIVVGEGEGPWKRLIEDARNLRLKRLYRDRLPLDLS